MGSTTKIAPDRQTDRDKLVESFLAKTRWKNSNVSPMDGDASRRRYLRLSKTEMAPKAILMDAPSYFGEDIRPFVSVAKYLTASGLNAPKLYDKNDEQGFLVLEDFGDAVFDKVCEHDPAQEEVLYDAAVDSLIHLAQQKPMSGLSNYTEHMAEVASQVVRWYVEPLNEKAPADLQEKLKNALDEAISILSLPNCTALRDFHAQNLIWLEQRSGVQRVGLLDFQDAMTGPLVYDLTSLTTDARRDVAPELRKRCEARFMQGLGLNRSEFQRDIATCSVQRNLRILMVFARMSLHFEKPNYVDLIPRVWGHLWADLRHPALSNLNMILKSALPEPTPENLTRLKEKCGTVPVL